MGLASFTRRPQQASRGPDAALLHALALLAPIVTVSLLVTYVAHHELGVDFRDEYWVAARRVLAAESPYLWSHRQIAAGVAFPYPAVAALALTPFGLLPRTISAALFVALSIAAVVVTLRVLTVRDWRVYALSFLLWPVISAWQAGNLTLVLALLIALVWRYRQHPIVAGLLVALAISLKPFVWPLALWLLCTRRYRASAWALAGGGVGNAAAWAVLGSREIGRYLSLSDRVTAAWCHEGYSLVASALRIGLSQTAAAGVEVVVSAALALICVQLGARRRDDAGLAVAVALMLAASPLVWNHYLALLIVPVAIMRPRLGPEWLGMLLLWLCPALHVTEPEALLAALVTVGTIWLIARDHTASGFDAARWWSQRRSARPHLLATTRRQRSQ